MKIYVSANNKDPCNEFDRSNAKRFRKKHAYCSSFGSRYLEETRV